jgi:hypothetical protein
MLRAATCELSAVGIDVLVVGVKQNIRQADARHKGRKENQARVRVRPV